ncbi:MAG: hypothetical protein ACTIL2_10185 [Corynebacterium sp.]|uniref:hypothetical protein n=1 Tax=Corynebacterium sp. TaxID=1720 RepID=UPI003F986D3B
MSSVYDFTHLAAAEFLRSHRKFIQHGVLVDLAEDLSKRIYLDQDDPQYLTFAQAIAYQQFRDQDVAATTYLRESSGSDQ